MLCLYRFLTRRSAPFLERLLAKRLALGKEDPERLPERKGLASRARPSGQLFWLHAASVGEAQSALILLKHLLARDETLHILVSTGTRTSAALMAQNLPERAFHQFYPLDHPDWVERFLDHWHPDMILWMESELWPNMLEEMSKRNIPTALINARLSPASARKWGLFKPVISRLLGSFSVILCQTAQDGETFRALGGTNITVTGNLKYAAAPLPVQQEDLALMQAALETRPCWLYASTHKGEEILGARVHETLKNTIPDLLTIIVPRHPERADEIVESLKPFGLNIIRRGAGKILPHSATDLYIADTIGELGLFYRLAPIACIGRSFSEDGGGGHNPIEAAQLHCIALHGSKVQNLGQIYAEMDAAGAAFCVKTESELTREVLALLSDPQSLDEKRKIAKRFTEAQKGVMADILSALDNMIAP